MGRTRVVNIRKETCDVYIGRAGYGKDGYFGNPFRLEATMAKGSTLGRYRKYFYHRLSTDKEFRKRIGNLQGKTLGCFCKPDPCHGDIIKEYLDWMAENANEAIVIGQIHWKGCVYPVREIDAATIYSGCQWRACGMNWQTICVTVYMRQWKPAKRLTVTVRMKSCVRCQIPICIKCIVERIIMTNELWGKEAISHR